MSARGLASLAAACLALAGTSPGGPPAGAADRGPAERRLAESGAEGLVLEGARWWTRSPDPGNPVACATCHFEPGLIRGWAASFPKVRPLPPPDRRVMTLLQANAEAVRLHYRLADPRPAATAITAYLTLLGRELPITPGVAEGQPVFPERIGLLERSVQRGETAFAAGCGACHAAAAAAAALSRFPRAVARDAESAESFIEGHRRASPPLVWDAPAMADLIAYLTARLRGRPVGPAPVARTPGAAPEENR